MQNYPVFSIYLASIEYVQPGTSPSGTPSTTLPATTLPKLGLYKKTNVVNLNGMAIVYKLIRQQFKNAEFENPKNNKTTFMYFWGEADRRETKNGRWLVGSDIESGLTDFRLDNTDDGNEYYRCPKNGVGSAWQSG